MAFEFKDIFFSFLDHKKKAVSTGTRQQTTYPNALKESYSQTLIIPELVSTPRGVYKLTEIGQYSFFNATNLRSIYIPASVKIIRNYGVSYLHQLENITFAKDSRLSVIEPHGLYDMYSIRELVFPGNCLKTMNGYSLAYAFSLNRLVLPASIQNMQIASIAGMKSLDDLYYCGSVVINEEVFYKDSEDAPVTNTSLRIHVSPNYQSNTFGGRSVTDRDLKEFCQTTPFVCSDVEYSICNTHFHPSLSLLLIMVYLI